MKKEISVCIVVLMIIIISVFNVKKLDEIEKDINTRITTIVMLSNDSKWDTAELEAQLLNDKWESYRNFTCIFLRHSEIDLVSTSIIDIISGVQTKDLTNVKNAAKLTEYQLKTLIEIEKISLESVF